MSFGKIVYYDGYASFDFPEKFIPMKPPPHIAQNIAETCQKYFQSFIAIEILPQHFCQLFQNISL